ncbi:lysophospholipase catalytic domain-containing protein [Penicillium malachiteum]|nr:lysophospholipase catalytic domain-containing protein [Penicillium malachiteum]
MRLTESIALGFLPFAIASPAPIIKPAVLRSTGLNSRAHHNAHNGYAPVNVTCPTNRPSIRGAANISPEEKSWLEKRREKTNSGLKEFFGHVKIDDFDALAYIESHEEYTTDLPTIGFAISGGGLAAALNGAGAFKAFDSRTEGTLGKGQLGGLLQSTTYFSALSGGSWFLGSIYINNLTSVTALQEEFWDFSSENFFSGPTSMTTTEFWGNLTTQIQDKKDAGFTVSDPDICHGGVDITWSSIAKNKAFQEADLPLPLVVLDGQSFADVESDPSMSEPIYEVTPWEFGTYDNSIYGFAPLEYLGTRFVDGKVPDNETCVRGFDNAGFITGTSSDIWNEDGDDIVAILEYEMSLLSPNTTYGAEEIEGVEYVMKEVIYALNTTNATLVGASAFDPNPFYQYNPDTSLFAEDKRLTLVDGGEDGQNVPFNPLIQRKRNVDVIFAVDSARTTGNLWPNGTTLVDAYERSLVDLANDTSFPSVPDVNTFLNLGLNAGPSFFGCNASNLTVPAPLIVYLPNHPITYMSNVTELQTHYNASARDDMITNGFNVATQANGTLDSEWTTCVGCAVLSRSFDRTKTQVPEACTRCFERYCWNGTIDSHTPAPYEPSIIL